MAGWGFRTVFAILIACLVTLPAHAFFTQPQAASGKALYEQHCAACHGAELMNGPRTTLALVGTEFIERWGAKAAGTTWTGLRVGDLLAENVTTMPPGKIGTIPLADQEAILAYMLQRNGFPAGDAMLTEASAKSRGATVAFQPTVGSVQKEQRVLVWVDRQGREELVPAPPRHYYLPRISPDGKQIAVEVHLDKPDIWIVDVQTGALRRLTTEGSNRYPAWSPDGTRVLYGSDRASKHSEVYWQPADGSGAAERLTFGEYEHAPQNWTADGKALSFSEIHPKTYRDIWMLPIEGDRKPWPFLRTPYLEGGVEYSKDGKWMVHTSNESGQYQVMLRAYPAATPARQITTEGGVEVIWPKGSREVFYRTEDGKRMSVEVITGDTMERTKVGTPKVLFRGDYVKSPGSRASWDSRDGQRFLVLKKAP